MNADKEGQWPAKATKDRNISGTGSPTATAAITTSLSSAVSSSTATEEKEASSTFSNIGYDNWTRTRAEWTKNSTGKERTGDLEEFDIQQVMQALRAYKKFPTNIPLNSMVELLTILWEEESL